MICGRRPLNLCARPHSGVFQCRLDRIVGQVHPLSDFGNHLSKLDRPPRFTTANLCGRDQLTTTILEVPRAGHQRFLDVCRSASRICVSGIGTCWPQGSSARASGPETTTGRLGPHWQNPLDMPQLTEIPLGPVPDSLANRSALKQTDFNKEGQITGSYIGDPRLPGHSLNWVIVKQVFRRNGSREGDVLGLLKEVPEVRFTPSEMVHHALLEKQADSN